MRLHKLDELLANNWRIDIQKQGDSYIASVFLHKLTSPDSYHCAGATVQDALERLEAYVNRKGHQGKP